MINEAHEVHKVHKVHEGQIDQTRFHKRIRNSKLEDGYENDSCDSLF